MEHNSIRLRIYCKLQYDTNCALRNIKWAVNLKKMYT